MAWSNDPKGIVPLTLLQSQDVSDLQLHVSFASIVMCGLQDLGLLTERD